MIGIENPEDRTVIGIYCHSDGYPEGVLKILKGHYTSEAKVRELMTLGDISSLGKDIGVPHNFDDGNFDVCRSYSRDRGESDTEAKAYLNLAAFLAAEYGQPYSYLFSNGQWRQVSK